MSKSRIWRGLGVFSPKRVHRSGFKRGSRLSLSFFFAKTPTQNPRSDVLLLPLCCRAPTCTATIRRHEFVAAAAMITPAVSFPPSGDSPTRHSHLLRFRSSGKSFCYRDPQCLERFRSDLTWFSPSRDLEPSGSSSFSELQTGGITAPSSDRW